MFEPIPSLGDEVVAFRGVGTITAEDYRTTLAPAVERATAGGRKARLLLELGDGFEGYDPGAVVADGALGVGRLGSFERIAVVTDAGWVQGAVHLFGALMSAEVRLFPVAAATDARAWISSRDTGA